MHTVAHAPSAAPGTPFACMAMESSTSSSADKKRNKLGYHRTSVACVHCRRRKIRCLLAPRDPHGRCENCIRLKKDCHFYPVDQQPPMDKKGGVGSKTDLTAADATTPPLIDQKDSYFQYATLPPNVQAGTPVGGSAMSTFSSDPMMAHDMSGGPATPLSQQHAVGWEDTAMYNTRLAHGVPVDTPMNPSPVNAAWTQGQTSAAPLTTASQIPSNAGLGLVAPVQPYPTGQEGQLWNSQAGRAMAMQAAPPDAAHVQYPSQLAPTVASNYKRPMTTTPVEAYPMTMTPPVPGLPSNAPVTYDNQSPPVGFTAWSGNPNQGAPGMLPNQVQPGWYPPGQLQYDQMKPEELAMLSSQGHMVDPNILQQHARKPG